MTAQQLKNSILQMAVQGKLVPQDPNDEPASVLLERIRAEKEQLIKQKKIKKERTTSYIFRGADNIPYEKIGDEVRSLADEIPFDIPDSWEWVRLGSISTYAETKQKINATSADPKTWGLDLEDIEKGGRLLERKTVGERKAVGDKTIFEKDDILYSKLRPYLLKVLVAPDAGICTPEIVPFRVYGGIDSNYIVNYLKSPHVDNLINSITYGVKMPRVGTETMSSLLVPLPPIEEQHRIVEKIGEMASMVSNYAFAYQKAEKLNSEFPAALKKSILQEAIHGKLVPQDPSDEPAWTLLERIRAEKQRLVKAGKIKKDKCESVIFRRDNSHYEKLDGIERCIDDEIPFEIPHSWMWTRFSEIASFQNGDRSRNYPNKSEYVTNGVAWINTGHITPEGYLDAHSMNYITEDKYRSLSSGHIQAGDLVYCLRGATFGKTARVEPFSQGAIASSLMIIRLIDIQLRDYVYWYLKSPTAYDELHKYNNGSAQPNLAAKDVARYLIPIPPVEEQHRIIQSLKNLMDLIHDNKH